MWQVPGGAGALVHAVNRRDRVPAKKAYRALTDLSYPPGRTAVAGDVVDDLPGDSIRWLLKDGLIQDADDDYEPVERPEPAPAYAMFRRTNELPALPEEPESVEDEG